MVELIKLFILLKRKKKRFLRGIGSLFLLWVGLSTVVDRINSLISSASADGDVGKKCKYPINA